MQAAKDNVRAPQPGTASPSLSRAERVSRWLDASARSTLLMPTVLIILFLSIFPLIVSVYLSVARFSFVPGGFDIRFIGLKNYEKLLLGSDQRYFLGKLSELGPLEWLLLAAFVAFMAYMWFRYVTSPRFRLFGALMRIVAMVIAGGIAWISLRTLTGDGLPGSLVVTLIYVVSGVSVQYVIGLGLALLLTQNLPGKKFFRVAFIMPMMITPVGIAFLFRMLTDTSKGPFAPIWVALGLGNFSWVNTPHGARMAVMIGDIWQWTPFVFIILLAALEGVSRETIEASLVDGANRLQLFRFIILPQITPVSTTVILIRMIEAFKIIDLPQVLTGGGPGTATEPMTLQGYKLWRTIDLGESSALAYLLLFVITFVAVVFVNSIRRRLLERL